MKKLNLFVMGLCVLLSGCRACTTCQEGKCEKFYALGCEQKAAPVVAAAAAAPVVVAATQQETVVVSEPVNNQIKYYVVEQDSSCISEGAVIKAPVVDKNVAVDPSDYKSFASRVAVKAKSDNFVTYEYRDIRVDELMPLAAHYCREHGDRTAILRKINLYRGYYRRVTFDCVRL